jgi:hypothetical protein
MTGPKAASPIGAFAPERGLDAPIRILSLAGGVGDGDGDGDGVGDGDGDGSSSSQAPISNGANNIEIRQMPINSANIVFFK